MSASHVLFSNLQTDNNTDSDFEEIELDDKTVINLPTVELLNTENNEEEHQQIILQLSDENNNHLIIKLVKDFGKLVFIRVISVGCYSLAWQMFIRKDIFKLLLGADFSNINNVALITRELMRFISNDAKLATNTQQLQEIFVSTHIGALTATLLAWTITQSYSFMLPLLGRDPRVAQELQLLPTKFLGNFIFGLTLSLQSNFALGRNELMGIVIPYSLGAAVIISAYSVINQFNDSLDGFLLANLMQNITITGTFLAYTHYHHRNERLIQSLFNYHLWLPAFKHHLHLMKNGLQPAGIFAIEVLSGLLITLIMRDKTELAAYQALLIIPTIFNAMVMTLESRIAVQAIEMITNLKNHPEKLARELKRLMLHSTWIGNLFPVIFFIIASFTKEQIVSLLIKPSAENNAIIEIAKNNMSLVLSLPFLRMLRGVPYSIITSQRQSEDPFHLRQNQYATLINTAGSLLALGLGATLDYAFDLGSSGFWLATAVTLGATWLGQMSLALASIHHETTASTNPPAVSSSWFGFMSSYCHRAEANPASPEQSENLLQRSTHMFTRMFRRSE